MASTTTPDLKGTTMSDYVRSLIRTGVPLIVGFGVAWLASRNITVDDTTQAQIVAGVTAVVTAIYYALVRALEQKFPKAGWLLGLAGSPAYSTPTPGTPAPVYGPPAANDETPPWMVPPT